MVIGLNQAIGLDQEAFHVIHLTRHYWKASPLYQLVTVGKYLADNY